MTERHPATAPAASRVASTADPDLLTLEEAVEFLRGSYAARTLQNLAWGGQLRHIGRGRRMLFLREWLLEDLMVRHRITSIKEKDDESQRQDDSWNSDAANQSAARIGASVPVARSPAVPAANADVAAPPHTRDSGLSGTSAASATANSHTAGASRTPTRFFGARKRTTGDSKTSA